MKPRVSVIIPCYNYAHYLRECLRSVFTQTLQDFEIIVVDDGSRDHTPEVVKEFHHRQLRYLRHEENLGTPRALNAGLALAQGELVTIIGADDRMHPENLQMKVDLLCRHSDVALAHSNAEVIDASGQKIGLIHKTENLGQVNRQQLMKSLLYGNSIVASSVVARKRCYEIVGPYDLEFRRAQDWEMWLRMSYSFPFVYLDSPLVQYRLHEKSATHDSFYEDSDLLMMGKIIDKTFRAFDLRSRGFAHEEVYWSNYFRLLHNKLGLFPARRILQLYLHGLRAYPRHVFTPKNISFILKIIAHALLPSNLVTWLKKQKDRSRQRSSRRTIHAES
jgi:glycosyltransferase involved in cell wall biosynthesis